MSAPLHFVYNALTGTFDLTGGSASVPPITSVTATDAGSSVSFETTGGTANLEVTDSLFNTIIGEGAGNSTIAGNYNTGFGYNVLSALTSGAYNSAFGANAGSILTDEIGNILIGQDVVGVVGESQSIRIGNTQTATYIAGISGNQYQAYSTLAMCIDPVTNRLGWKNFTDGLANTFIGNNSGNATRTGIANTGFGQAALPNLVSGSQNTAMGNGALLGVTDGSANSAFGYLAGQGITTGTNNNAFGVGTFSANCLNDNNAFGTLALQNNLGQHNSAFGSGSLQNSNAANFNTAIGSTCASGLLTGTNNFFAGYFSGNQYNGAESGNILIDNIGVTAENNAIHLGTNQTDCWIAGINGATVTGSAVLCATDGKLGTVVSSERYKENIEYNFDHPNILDLNVIKFNYKNDYYKNPQYGLLAEDVNQKFPYLCLYDLTGQPQSVKYHELCTFLLLEMKKMNKRVSELENK